MNAVKRRMRRLHPRDLRAAKGFFMGGKEIQICKFVERKLIFAGSINRRCSSLRAGALGCIMGHGVLEFVYWQERGNTICIMLQGLGSLYCDKY